MRHDFQSYFFPGAFAPVLSLEELASRLDPETGVADFDIPDSSRLADAELERTEVMAAVSRFVQSLPERERSLVHRYFWEDETQTQIAAHFGVSKMAISKAMARIVKRGRKALAAHEHSTFMN